MADFAGYIIANGVLRIVFEARPMLIMLVDELSSEKSLTYLNLQTQRLSVL